MKKETKNEMESNLQHKYPIPQNLNIREIIVSEPIHNARCSNQPEKQVDRAVFLLGLFFTVRYHNWDDYESDMTYVRLSSSVLRKYVKDYNKYFQYFEDKGIIEVNHSYQSQGFCKGYRFTAPYRNVINKFVDIKEPKFNKKITKEHSKVKNIPIKALHQIDDKQISDWINPAKAYPVLFKTLNEITLDEAGAHELLEEERFNLEISLSKANKYLYFFEAIKSGNIYFKKDMSGGRIHTSITSFPSQYRKFILHPRVHQWGKVDIRNCQPFLLSILLYDNNLSKYIYKERGDTQYPIMLPAFENLPEDAKRYIELCRRGELYERLMEIMHVETGKKLTRDESKDIILKHLFEPVHYPRRCKEVFKKNFPKVFAKVAEINKDFEITKKRRKEQGLKEADKNMLSFFLLSAESHMVLGVIVKRLNEEFPNMPILTIHDALMFPEEYMSDVVRIIEEEFRKWTGITPALSQEILCVNCDESMVA